jgi:hypothetical protein
MAAPSWDSLLIKRRMLVDHEKLLRLFLDMIPYAIVMA